MSSAVRATRVVLMLEETVCPWKKQTAGPQIFGRRIYIYIYNITCLSVTAACRSLLGKITTLG